MMHGQKNIKLYSMKSKFSSPIDLDEFLRYWCSADFLHSWYRAS